MCGMRKPIPFRNIVVASAVRVVAIGVGKYAVI